MKRYLVTTADERSWKFDRPVLFLGEWCRLYDRKHIWSGMEAIVAEPYGLESEERSRGISYVLALTGQILTELTQALNNVHQTQHSERYWNIVLGHWLLRYVSVAFNRYHTLDQAISNYEISGTTFFAVKDYSLATADSLSFIWACNDDVWNHVLYSRLMAYRGDVQMNPSSALLEGCKGFSQEEKRPDGHRSLAKGLARKLVRTVGQKLARSSDAFIINSYLPVKDEIKLQLALGQIPQRWSSPSFERVLPDAAVRAELVIDYDKHEGVERYIRWQLAETIPTCYLEGYKGLDKIAKSLPWPEKPKFIFTSNNFAVDEIFKVWTASKVEQGVPYFTGQHGNSYGTHLYAGNANLPERAAADKFFTWGWSDENSNTVPAFNFKTSSWKSGEFNPEGGLLLIELHVPQRITPWDDYFEFGIYQQEQFRFVAALPEIIQQKLKVRLHSACRKLRWSDEQRWKDFSPHTQIETGAANIKELIVQSRLVVHSYDSTGILETLALNIPTVCFWQGGLDHLLPDAKPYYELLRDANILADSPEQAAELIALHWDNINDWWESQKVQDARKSFCEQYARTAESPVRTLKQLLTMYASTEGQ